MQSYKKRLGPIKDQVIKAYKVGGYGEVWDRGYAKDPIAFEKWLREECKDELSETVKPISYDGMPGLLDLALEKFIRKVVDLQATNEKLSLEIAYLKAQLKDYDYSHTDKLLELVEICK